MTLSVIIPVYNVRWTIFDCVESVVSQNIDDMEIILVDDGSTDTSGLLADRLAEIHSCVTCYHKENGGLSDARNYGIEHAKGEFITFVDSDDQLVENTYQALIDRLKADDHIDILEYPVILRAATPEETVFWPGCQVYENAIDWLAYKGTEHCWAWNKIYRRRAIDGIRFALGEKFEDVLFMAEVIRRNPVIATTDHGLYLYFYNDNGIAATDRKDGLVSLLRAQLHLVNRLGIDTRERRWHRLYMDLLTSQLYAYRKTGQLLIKPQRISIKGYATWKDSVKALLLNVAGLKNTCRLFKLMSYLRKNKKSSFE